MPRKPGDRNRPNLFRKDLDLLIRQTHEQNTVIIIKLSNLQLEVSQLRSSVTTLLSAFHTILALDREDPMLAEKVRKEYLSLTHHAYAPKEK